MKKGKRLFIMKKSRIVTVALICMLVLAGYLNYVSAPTEEAVTVSGDAGTEIPEVKNYGEARFVSKNAGEEMLFERERQLSGAKALLKELSENKNLTPEQRAEAEKKLVALGEAMTAEINITSVLSSTGIRVRQTVVGNSGVTVIIEEKPDEKTLDIIRDAAMREAGVTADKIVVKVAG